MLQHRVAQKQNFVSLYKLVVEAGMEYLNLILD
jgi:hypothetical protein